MEKKITLIDIAAAVGVSNVTVYNALANKPGVSENLRSQIKDVAEQMGYKKPSNARTNSRENAIKTGNIGVLIPEQYYGYSTSFYGQFYELVVKELYNQNHYGIMELLSPENMAAVRLPMVLQGVNKVDGLIILGQISKSYMENIIDQSKVPIFFLDTYQQGWNIDTVISNGFFGAYILTNYLIRQGHRKIAFVGSVDATSSVSDRYWGYRKALREHQIEFQEAWEIPDRDEFGKTYEVVIDHDYGVEAFVCNCDYIAYVVIQDLSRQGIRVPENVSVVGFDDFLPLMMGENNITSYQVNMQRMAHLCVSSLIRKINGKKYAEGVQTVTGKIIYRESVAPRKLL